jgi:hypothetical protein
MAFVKLDCGILNSTLWFERDCREIFITALLMAHPIELREPMPQYEVGSLKETGFVVPPGWYGFVPAAGPGIIRMAMCEMSSGMAALARLGGPDAESRTPDFEGRRLVRVDGGFVVLNFIKYREKDATTADRSARYRERKKRLTEAESHRDVLTSRRDVTAGVTRRHQAEAEAEAEQEKYTVPAALVASGDGYSVPDCPYNELVAAYHEECPSLPKVRIMTNMRLKHARARWVQVATEDKTSATETLAWFRKFFAMVERQDFLTGRCRNNNGRPWTADFEWLMNAGNFAKVVEGRYTEDKK